MGVLDVLIWGDGDLSGGSYGFLRVDYNEFHSIGIIIWTRVLRRLFMF